MVQGKGSCVIDGVMLGEVSVDFMVPSPVLQAKYALVNIKNGFRYGAGTRNHWSGETRKKLLALVESMEKDISMDLFGGGTTTGSGPVEEEYPDGTISGL